MHERKKLLVNHMVKVEPKAIECMNENNNNRIRIIEENKMTIAQKLENFLKRNTSIEEVKIEPRKEETYIEFTTQSWSKRDLEQLFSYWGIHITNWLKMWCCNVDTLEIPKPIRTETEFDDEKESLFQGHPKKYVHFLDDGGKYCPSYPITETNCFKDHLPACETCAHNFALYPTIRVQLWIKPEIKDCSHEFHHQSNWDYDVCCKCGFMQYPVKKEGISQ